MPNASAARKTRPAPSRGPLGRAVDSAGSLGTIAATVASLDRDRLHHAVHEVRLAVLGIGKEAEQDVIAWCQINGELAALALVHGGQSAQEARRRRTLLTALFPRRQVGHRLARRELRERE